MTLRAARHLAALLLVYLAATVANSATVTVGDVPPAVDATAPAADLSALLSSAVAERDGAGLDIPPTLTADAQLGEGGGSASPLLLQSGTGKDTRLSVDMAAINATAEKEGWPTWAKVTVIIGGVAVVALASWAIVEATQNGSHSSHADSSTHYNVQTDGTGNTSTVVIHSPAYMRNAPEPAPVE